MGLRVWVSGFGVRFRVEGLECEVRRVYGVGCWGLGLQVEGVQCVGCLVPGLLTQGIGGCSTILQGFGCRLSVFWVQSVSHMFGYTELLMI